MRTPDITRVHDGFLRALREAESRFSEIGVFLISRKERPMVRWAAEMTLVSAVTAWEKYLVELLIVLICRHPTRFVSVLELPELTTFVTRPLVEAVFTAIRYMEVRSYQEIKKHSNRYLEDATNPFGRVPDPFAAKLDDSLKIRNHIVHGSRQSKEAYQKVLRRRGVEFRIPTPGLFLVAVEGGRSRLAMLLSEMRDAVALIRV